MIIGGCSFCCPLFRRRCALREKLKPIGKYLVPSLLLIWFPARFYWDVFHYHTHFEDMFSLFMEFSTIIFCAVSMIRAFKRRSLAYMALIAATMLSCIFFGYWINRIPFCTECDHVRRSELGFMLEPFANRFGYFWPE